MANTKVTSMAELLDMEAIIGSVTSGYMDPSVRVFDDTVPVELIVAWKQHFEATVKLKAELAKVKS
ncbi:hypothetical protein NVP1244A_126 [Vibrio phage 1.244.A._10N.261.54.C3]|nr:hypothetical protein NVP1244A_126 [Vibrio phage 1.244.A._10N.261.54.C3]AUR98754.1 hypothetical protein NVP1255O_126 [Vibrio phage 1.255.O._10N.286.45.F1]